MAKPDVATAAPERRQYLTFFLDRAVMALPLERVREIVAYSTPRPVPRSPGYVSGVINLRGAVVPIINLSRRFGQVPPAIDMKTCFLILETLEEQAQPIGIVLSAVNEVLSLTADAIEPAPAFGGLVRAEFIEGICKSRGRFVTLLNVQRMVDFSTNAASGDDTGQR
jgi:purine-binding chemotaxis protein CheW